MLVHGEGRATRVPAASDDSAEAPAPVVAATDDSAEAPAPQALAGGGDPSTTAEAPGDPAAPAASGEPAHAEPRGEQVPFAAGRWVQLASFRGEDTAEAEAERLRLGGLDEQVIASDGVEELLPGFHVLAAGPFDSSGEERGILQAARRLGIRDGHAQALTPAAPLDGDTLAGEFDGELERVGGRSSTSRLAYVTLDGDATGMLFSAEPDCTATLRLVERSDGQDRAATAPVEIRPDATAPPGPPQRLSVTPGADARSLELGWQAPTDTGGGPVAGYHLLIEQAGEPAAALAADPEATSAKVDDLGSGVYRVTIAAVNDAGTGAPATTLVDLLRVQPGAGAPAPPGAGSDTVAPPSVDLVAPPLGSDERALGGAARDTLAPRLVGLSIAPRRFRVTGGRGRGGARVAYRLSEEATVEFRAQRARTGRRAGRRCVAPTRRNGSRPRCLRHVTVPGRVVDDGQPGANRVHFDGRVDGRTLPPGRYRLGAVAIDAAGNASVERYRPFRVVRR